MPSRCRPRTRPFAPFLAPHAPARPRFSLACSPFVSSVLLIALCVAPRPLPLHPTHPAPRHFLPPRAHTLLPLPWPPSDPPVSEFLQLDPREQIPAHQDLLRAGKLVRYQTSFEGRVIFLSHQVRLNCEVHNLLHCFLPLSIATPYLAIPLKSFSHTHRGYLLRHFCTTSGLAVTTPTLSETS